MASSVVFWKKSICVLGSSYLLSTTEQEQRRERQSIGKEHIWQCPIDFHFLLHQITIKKKMFFTNGTHGVSIVKMCLLKNSFHKRSYCAKEVIFSLWGPLATFCLLSPKNSCYGIFGFVVILLCLSLSWFLCICACMYVCSHLHMCICVPLYLNSFSSPLLSL